MSVVVSSAVIHITSLVLSAVISGKTVKSNHSFYTNAYCTLRYHCLSSHASQNKSAFIFAMRRESGRHSQGWLLRHMCGYLMRDQLFCVSHIKYTSDVFMIILWVRKRKQNFILKKKKKNLVVRISLFLAAAAQNCRRAAVWLEACFGRRLCRRRRRRRVISVWFAVCASWTEQSAHSAPLRSVKAAWFGSAGLSESSHERHSSVEQQFGLLLATVTTVPTKAS